MLKYNTTLPDSPAVGRPAPDIRSPYAALGQSHSDVLAARMASSNADYRLAQDRGDADYGTKRRAAEQQLALGGLRQMAQAQQNQASLRDARIGNVTSLLAGLFS